jgi:hypothetical protein
MRRIIRPGKVEDGNLYIKIKYEDKKGEGHEGQKCLSLIGVVGPKSNGDARGSCGQVTGELLRIKEYAPSWDEGMARKLYEVWECWHLNDMNASCEHQVGPAWDTSREIRFVGYQSTYKAKKLKLQALQGPLLPEAYEILGKVNEYHGESLNAEAIPEDVTRLEAEGFLEPWHWEQLEKTEVAGWVSVKRGGLLDKPCPTCGYKYGTGWLYRAVPEDVISFLFSLPETDTTPAWV